jgi:hypothetical protein
MGRPLLSTPVRRAAKRKALTLCYTNPVLNDTPGTGPESSRHLTVTNPEQNLPISPGRLFVAVKNPEAEAQLWPISAENIITFMNNSAVHQARNFATDRIRGSLRFIRNRLRQGNFALTVKSGTNATNQIHPAKRNTARVDGVRSQPYI